VFAQPLLHGKAISVTYSECVFVALGIQTCTLDDHLHRITYTRRHINTTDSPDDEHSGARKM